MTNSAQGRSSLLVFGDDGSPTAEASWEWINNHSWPGWRVEVVTATEPPLASPTADDFPPLVEWDPPGPRQARPESGIVAVRHLTAPADPRILLSRCTEADLLVVGTRGLTPVRALLLGSTAEWLLAQPTAPMAVVHNPTPSREILVLADGSDSSRSALEAFVEMPWAPQTEVVVLSVNDGRTDVKLVQQETLDCLSARGISATAVEATGRPTTVILRHLEKTRPQLVALGTQGLTGLGPFRLGSTASAVIRHGNCNAMVGRRS